MDDQEILQAMQKMLIEERTYTKQLIQSELQPIKDDIAELKDDITELKDDMQEVKATVNAIGKWVDAVRHVVKIPYPLKED